MAGLAGVRSTPLGLASRKETDIPEIDRGVNRAEIAGQLGDSG
jgi:hypothetical protein